MVNRSRLGALLVVVGIASFVVMVVGSAALAPDRGVGNANQHTLVGIHGGGPGLHEDGSVVLFGPDGDVVWRESSADSYFDVTPLENGRVMAGFTHSGYEDCGPYSAPCAHTGFRIIEPDPEPHVVFEYSFPVRTMKNSEVHDVERLPSGEYLMTDMEYERIFTIAPNKTITWQWNASSFYDAPADPTEVDWLHINDVDRIGPDRFLVSVRNANQLVIVERGEGVVEVINEDTTDANDGVCQVPGRLADRDGDGEIRCGDPALFKEQHNPQWLGQNAILVADSTNNRIVEIHRNETGWEIAWQLSSTGGIPLSWPRDADRLENRNTLITDSVNQRVVEVNQSGAVVWSRSTPGVIPYEADVLRGGETVGGPQYERTASFVNRETIPVLTRVLSIMQTSYPIPFWVSEVHLLVGILSVGAVVSGTYLLISSGRILGRVRETRQ